MISKISFGSKYRVDSNNNSRANFNKFQKYTLSNALKPNTKIKIETEQDDRHPENNNGTCILSVPCHADKEVESYCEANGIKFTKQPSESIIHRIEKPEGGKRLIRVDANKLERLIRRQESNIDYCKKTYEKYYEDEADKMIRGGEHFPATTLYLKYINDSGSIEDFKDYISKYGKNGLSRGSLIVDFVQKTTEPDHCVYFALRNAGIRNIPVYVNNETYEIGHALGLFIEH